MKEVIHGEGVRGVWDKYKFAALVCALGALLMLWPGPIRSERRESAEAVRDIQGEMEEALGKIGGVGRVRLMLTEESGGERILAENRTASQRGETDLSQSSEIVLLDGGSGDEVVVTRTLYPVYRGALVVCEGGDRPSVRLAVTRAVSALTGLSADRIAVEKWQ